MATYIPGYQEGVDPLTETLSDYACNLNGSIVNVNKIVGRYENYSRLNQTIGTASSQCITRFSGDNFAMSIGYFLRQNGLGVSPRETVLFLFTGD